MLTEGLKVREVRTREEQMVETLLCGQVTLADVPQEIMQMPCGICQSPTHVDADCPTVKLREMTERMNERGASLRVERSDMSDSEVHDDGKVAGNVSEESERGGVELGSMAIVNKEVEEFLNNKSTEATTMEEEVAGDTAFMHVGGSPSYFVMPFAVHKTAMRKETLAKSLDEKFQEEQATKTNGW